MALEFLGTSDTTVLMFLLFARHCWILAQAYNVSALASIQVELQDSKASRGDAISVVACVQLMSAYCRPSDGLDPLQYVVTQLLVSSACDLHNCVGVVVLCFVGHRAVQTVSRIALLQ